jgi:alpha-mannosidase
MEQCNAFTLIAMNAAITFALSEQLNWFWIELTQEVNHILKNGCNHESILRWVLVLAANTHMLHNSRRACKAPRSVVQVV